MQAANQKFIDRIRSLGFRTDLIFHRFDGEVLDRGEYLTIRTPSQPGYYWGNLLYFQNPPAEGDFERWETLFKQEFGHMPGVRHRTFAWDSIEAAGGAVEPFLKDGFHVDSTVVMTCRTVKQPVHLNTELTCRPLMSDADWSAAVELGAASNDEGFPQQEFHEFVKRRMAAARRMAQAGLGDWWGAFEAEKLIGNCGLFFSEELGRFQSVSTHPEYRKRGVCSTLMHHVTSEALQRAQTDVVILVADPKGAAYRIYNSLGFEVEEKTIGICRYPHRNKAKE